MADLPEEVNTTYGDVLAEYAEKYNPVPHKAADPRKSASSGIGGSQLLGAVANGAEAPQTPQMPQTPMSPLYEDLLSTLFYDTPETGDAAVGGSLYHESLPTEVDYEYDYGQENGYPSGGEAEPSSEGEKYEDYIGSRTRGGGSVRSAPYTLEGAAALADIRDQLIDVDTSVATLEDRVIEIKDLSVQTSARAEDNACRLEDLGRDVGLLRDQVSRIEATLATLVKILLEPAGLEKAKQYAGTRK